MRVKEAPEACFLDEHCIRVEKDEKRKVSNVFSLKNAQWCARRPLGPSSNSRLPNNLVTLLMDTIGSPKESKCSSISCDKIEHTSSHCLGLGRIGLNGNKLK